MRLLLDTNVVLWLLLGDRRRLPAPVVEALEDLANSPMVSAVSMWEIALKRSLGKLSVEDRWLGRSAQTRLRPPPGDR